MFPSIPFSVLRFRMAVSYVLVLRGLRCCSSRPSCWRPRWPQIRAADQEALQAQQRRAASLLRLMSNRVKTNSFGAGDRQRGRATTRAMPPLAYPDDRRMVPPHRKRRPTAVGETAPRPRAGEDPVARVRVRGCPGARDHTTAMVIASSPRPVPMR